MGRSAALAHELREAGDLSLHGIEIGVSHAEDVRGRSDLLFSPNGRWSLVGFGRDPPIQKKSGAMAGWAPFFQAAELVTGASPTPFGDYIALLLFTRSLLSDVEITGTLARFLHGEVGPTDLELLDLFDGSTAGSNPVRDARCLGDQPAGRGAERHAGAEGYQCSSAERRGGCLVVLGWRGEHQRLGGALRRVLVALLHRHTKAPAASPSIRDVLEPGWPGERPVVEAGDNRVHVAIARLRGRGLRDSIDRFKDGYRISPGTGIHAAE